MNKFVIRQSLILLLCAIIWGSAFVAQSIGMDYVGPFTYLASRSYVGFLFLLPVTVLFDKLRKNNSEEMGYSGEVDLGWKNKALPIGGLCCGVVLFVSSALQQIGIKYTTVGKAGFITAMYIVLVPIVSIFLKKRAGIRIWISVAIAVVGLYLLCITGDFGFQTGDLFVLTCALGYTFHILVIDHFSPNMDGVRLSCIQFLVCGVLSTAAMFLFEQPDPGMITAAWQSILYAGIMSSGIAYTLQIIGQRGLNPTLASLIMSMESVFAVISGFLFLGQSMSTRELSGCGLMFFAIILSQLPEKKETN